MSNIVTSPKNNITPYELALIKNDLSALTPEERVDLYNKTCESLGLNPLTQPFGYLSLGNKLCLYAKKDTTDQLRKIHNVSITITSRTKEDGIYCVTAKPKMPDGREDESLGAVSIANLKGDALANALMKAETKAKRRATLSICGLGMLDETEIETIPNAKDVTPNATSIDNLTPEEITKLAQEKKNQQAEIKPIVKGDPVIASKAKVVKNETPCSMKELQALKEIREVKGISQQDIISACAHLFELTDLRFMKMWHFTVLYELIFKSGNRDEFGVNLQKAEEEKLKSHAKEV